MTKDEFRARLEAKGAKIGCPSCGRDDWKADAIQIDLRGASPKNGLTELDVIVATCQQCSYVATYDRKLLDSSISSPHITK